MAKSNSIVTIHPHSRIGKLLLACATLMAAFSSCSSTPSGDEPSDSVRVTFNIGLLSVYTDTLSTERDEDHSFTVLPHHNPPADITLSQANMTDLWVFEGNTLLAHQRAGQSGFGSPSVELSHGSHSLTFIASPQPDQTFVDGIWSAPKANDCFGAVVPIEVSTATTSSTIILCRCTYGLRWQSTDIVPPGVAKLRLKVAPMRESMTDGLRAVGVYARTYTYDVSAYVGRTISVTVFGLPEYYGVEDHITTTIEFLSATDAVLYSHSKYAPVLTNRRTIITGALFNGSASSSIRVNSEWLPDYEEAL